MKQKLIIELSFSKSEIEEILLERASLSNPVLKKGLTGTITCERSDAPEIINLRFITELKEGRSLLDANDEILWVDSRYTKEQKEEILATSTKEIGLSVREYNCIRHTLKTVEDLAKEPKSSLLKYRHLGKQTLDEIERKLLEKFGIKLKD